MTVLPLEKVEKINFGKNSFNIESSIEEGPVVWVYSTLKEKVFLLKRLSIKIQKNSAFLGTETKEKFTELLTKEN
jgi:hypothetical protein